MRLFSLLVLLIAAAPALAQPNVLLVTDSDGFVHGAVKPPEGENLVAQTVEQIVASLDGTFARTADAAEVAGQLDDTDVLVMYTTGPIPLDVPAVRQFVENGGGLVGIHCATDTLKENEDFYTLLGGTFESHPWTANDSVVLRGLDRDHPVSRAIGGRRALKEEIYQFKNFDPSTVRVLVSLDTQATPKKVGGNVPIVWVKQVGEGRVVYTSLGHRADVWKSGWYQEHLREAIRFAAGEVNGSTEPNPVAFERQEIIGQQERRSREREEGEAAPSSRPGDQSAAPQRGHEPWVFRCVLDRRPRVVVAALSDDLWAAWDATTCGLYKVFPGEAQGGGMNFTGSVYDTRHGPQPQTKGNALDTFGGSDLLQLWKDGQPVDIDPQWAGYAVDGDDSLTLRYQFTVDGHQVEVRETPQVVGPRTLRRNVSVQGLPSGYGVRMALANGEDVQIDLGEAAADAASVIVEQRGQPVALLFVEQDADVTVTTNWPQSVGQDETN